MPVTRDRWKRIPFTDGIPIPFKGTYSRKEFDRIRAGLAPEVMEDKWFIYFEEPYLFLHHSWTGQPIYRVTFAATDDGASVAEALCIAEAIAKTGQEYEAAFLGFLISNLLLGEDRPFPVPPRARSSVAGLLQHMMAGTGFPPAFFKSGPQDRSWWRFWRRGR